MSERLGRTTVWCLGLVGSLVVVAGLAVTVRADLSPREYRRLQREAPEVVRIEVVNVHERAIREREREFEIVVEAKVVRIERTAARIRDGEVIRITYPRHRREHPVPGPGEPPLLERGRVYPAFLAKVEGERRFAPAAGAFSFERLDERRP
jgi:hypothetical protein